MSSEDDEFFDAPDAFTCSSHVRRWSDNEDEFVRSTFNFENKNVERRNRVESLKKSFAEHSYNVGSHIQQATGNTTSRTSLTDDNVFLHGLGSPENKGFLPVYAQTQDAPIGSALLTIAHPQELGDRPWLSHRSFLQASENASAISERKSELFTRSLMPAAAGLAGDPSATQLMSADLHNLIHSDLPAPHFFYNGRAHTVQPSSPPGAPRIPATIATLHTPCLFPTVLDQAPLHPFSVIPHLSETHTSSIQRTQVISSAPEVSYSSTPAQDSDAWVAYVKSWSLDAASPNGILHSSHQAPNTLIRPYTDGMPIPEPTGDMVVQKPICETLHPGRFDGVKPLDSSALSNLVSYQPACAGNACCLHKPRQFIDSAALHHRDSQLATDNMVTCRPVHTEICKHAATLPPPATIDFEDKGATLQATTDTMTSQRHTLNPIEAHFRSLTESGASLQDTVEPLTDSGAATSIGNSSAFRKISRFQRYFREAVSAVKSATRTKIFNQDEETSDEDEEVIGNQGIRVSHLSI
ncbi:hypothetical protein PHET_08103 [Paragonimus heterotremus]|uniref:Uncharacterized protein n=1 Tax=Paragonimus heterotremus TaxID=100268 RepID=A0A8J4T7A8_9TREM|nr:hypothetical protein PHET_08103 [Paragonimus heterotremus]